MSIEYTIYEDDDPTKKVLFTCSLSNTSHSFFCDKAKLYRRFRDNETGQEFNGLYHTTIHDDERICFDGLEWFERYWDNLAGEDDPISFIGEMYDILTSTNSDCVYV